MKWTFVVLILSLCGSVAYGRVRQAGVGKTPTVFEQTLITAEKAFIEAAKKGDAAFLKQTLTGDFSYVSYDGQLYQRQEMIDQFAQPGTNIQPYEMKVVSAGDDVAIVTYNVVFRVPPAEDQGPPPRYQHFTTIWVKQGNIWKMKFQQMTATHWGDW